MRVELNGGRYPFDKSTGQSQKAIIEFLCDAERTGLEGAEGDDRDKIDDEETNTLLTARADDDKKGDGEKDGEDGEKDGEKNKASLSLISYKVEGEGDRQTEVLRLQWKTKYACEGQTEHKPSPSKSSHWGFFTWFLIM